MLFPRSGERKRALLARLTGLFGPTRPPPDTPHPARRGLFFSSVQAHGALFYSREQHQMVWGMCQASEESGISWGGGEHSFSPPAAAPAVSEDLRRAVLWVSTAAMAR